MGIFYIYKEHFNMENKDEKEYTLYYFPLYVRGEACNMLLTHAGVTYEDKVIPFAEWKDHKATMPNQQVPTLEFKDGKKMGQSLAMLRFLGRKYGYYPEDPMKAFLADALCDQYEGILSLIYKPHFAKEEDREEMCKNIFEKTLPNFMKQMEEHLTNNESEGKWLCGDKLSIADFHVGGLYTNFLTNDSISFETEKWLTFCNDYPKFKEYGQRFAAENQARLDKRGKYPV